MTLRVEETADIAACRALRVAVFVDEQAFPLSEEFDAVDDIARHLLALKDGAPIGTARVYAKDGTGWIGRICVLAAGRGHGIGAALVRQGIVLLRSEPTVTEIALGAQVHAIPFYEKLGFAVSGPIYDDLGVPHREMRQPA
ncbi:GNAT family N-acetyltransferase [Puniceibacterium sediminis]|uniref:ElaA protein n=1 Tax=Puniceibacterium sediminis TaxID=1608407 RepID=A0A238VG42_9RHOB|nr:GNAT family N-acetyltransferase [Puniceibacterium sediminis]SNR33047.1 ElaA protein [Puniceibacterium sediminis]